MSTTGRYEARCRLLLRTYPRSWRAHREQEILGVLMAMQEQHDEDPRASHAPAHRPSWGVHLDLLTGGLQTRWERLFSFLPAVVRDRIAMLGLVLGAAVCTVILAFGEIAWPWRTAPVITLTDGSSSSYVAPLIQTAGPVVYGLWVLALLLTLAGRAQLGRWLLAGAAAGAVLLSIVRVIPHPPVYVLAPLALAAGLSTIGRLPTARTTRGWMAVGYVALTGALAATQVSQADTSTIWNPFQGFYRPGYADQGMHSLSVAVLALSAVCVVAATIASLTGRRWFVAVLVTALPYLYLTLLSFSGVDRHQMLSTAAELTTVLLVGTALVVAGAKWARRDASRPADHQEPLS